MKHIFTFLVLVSASGFGIDLLDYVSDLQRSIEKRFEDCGIEFVPPPVGHHHVDWALYDKKRNAFVGFYYRSFHPNTVFNYTRPNGSSVAEIVFRDRRFVSFNSPVNGEIARMEDVMGNGHHMRFVCGHRYVSKFEYENCVETFFLQPLLGSYCSF